GVFVGAVQSDLAIKAAWAEQGAVQNIRAVSSGQYQNVFMGFKAVHLREDLVEGLFPLVMAATQASAPGTADGIQLVNKDQRRGLLAGILKHVPNPGGANPHKHLDEFGRADAE